MSKRLSNPVLSQAQANVLLLNCMVCGESVEGFYARYGNSGTCSATCMNVQDQKPRYPGHSHEEFCQRFNI